MAMELEAVRRLVQERGSDLAFVVNHSGGKDSTRMLGFVRNTFRDCSTYVVMADIKCRCCNGCFQPTFLLDIPSISISKRWRTTTWHNYCRRNNN